MYVYLDLDGCLEDPVGASLPLTVELKRACKSFNADVFIAEISAVVLGYYIIWATVKVRILSYGGVDHNFEIPGSYPDKCIATVGAQSIR